MGARILPVNWLEDSVDLAATTQVATMPVTNLQSDVRSDVWRSTSVSSTTVSGDFDGNARPISCWGVWPGAGSMLGSQVRVKIWSDLAKTILVYDSGVLNFLDFSGAGWGDFAWGQTPWGFDPSDRVATKTPLVRYFPVVTGAAFEIIFTNSGAMNATYFEVSRIWLADYVEAPYNAAYGISTGFKSNSQHQRAPGGTLRRNLRANWREHKFDLTFRTEADRATWHDLMWACCDPGKEVVFSFFQDMGRLEHHFTIMGSLAAMNPLVYTGFNEHKLQIVVEES